jgi:hypothetical protein
MSHKNVCGEFINLKKGRGLSFSEGALRNRVCIRAFIDMSECLRLYYVPLIFFVMVYLSVVCGYHSVYG